MKISKDARAVLNELLVEYNDSFFEFMDEFSNQGICYECGSFRHEVEPDAEGYECENCNANAVYGIEQALLMIS